MGKPKVIKETPRLNRNNVIKITDEMDTFLSLVEVRPFLFDPSCDGYKNRDLRRLAWEEIGNGCEPKLSADQAKKKYEGLRDAYSRKKRKRIPTGSAAEKKSNQKFMSRLSFLDRFVKHRKTCGNYESQENDDDDEDDDDDNNESNETRGSDNENEDDKCSDDDFNTLSDSESVESQIQSPPIKEPKRKVKITKKSLEDELKSKILQFVDAPNDEDEMYGMTIANDIKKLSPRKKAFAKAKISQALYEATLQNHESIPTDFQDNNSSRILQYNDY